MIAGIKNAMAVLLLILALLLACQSPSKQTDSADAARAIPTADTLIRYTVKPAPEWTELFYRDQGWFGADGCFSIPLHGVDSIAAGKGNKTMLLFSDTMTGDASGDSVRHFKMINNSMAIVNGLEPSEQTVQIQYKQDEEGNPATYFVPSTPASRPGEYYWMGDGFVNKSLNDTLYILAYRVRDKSDASWDFELTGTCLIKIPPGEAPPFEQQLQVDAPLFLANDSLGNTTFGSGIFANTSWAGAPQPDGYIYIFGIRDQSKELLVARVADHQFHLFEAWRFWDGSSWHSDISKSASLTDRVSNELSFSPLPDGRYLLVFQSDGIGKHTAIRIAEHPTGPYGPLQKIWRAPEIEEEPGLIPYNAKAHPALSYPDRILISYNTISLDYFNDILKYPHMYRPRFIWLAIDQ